MDVVTQSGIVRSLVIKGEVVATESFVIGARIEGQVVVREGNLTILEGAEVHAQVIGKTVVVLGKVVGGVEALERLELAENSSVEGDIKTPRIAMAAGAIVNGTVEMRKVL